MIERTEMRVLGMRCAGCAAGIEKKLRALQGIEDAVVDFSSTRALIRAADETWSSQSLAQKIQSFGYQVFPWEQPLEQEGGQLSRRLVIGVLLFLPLFILSMFFEPSNKLRILQACLALPAFAILGRPYFLSALHSFKSGILGMDVLIALGSGSALLYSLLYFTGLTNEVYFDGSIAILVFITVGKLLEERAKKSAFSSLEELMTQDRKPVRVVTDSGEIEEKEPSKLVAGEKILVPAGEFIPVDGIVLNGESSVDESFLTGEALPVFKEAHSEVLSGSKNLEQVLEVEVIRSSSESAMAQISAKVREAQMEKASLQRIADRISSIFVPVVLVLASGTALYWGITEGLGPAFLHSVSVLLIACPCALGLATPAAFSVGLYTGLKKGILIRSVRVIENISRVTHLVLDKTGTLTKGKPSLKEIHNFGSHSRHELLALLYGLEQGSVHPFAHAVLENCQTEGVKPILFENLKGSAGKGIEGVYEGHNYRVGNESFLTQNSITIPIKMESMGFFLARQKEVLAFFEFEDPARVGLASLRSFLQRPPIHTALLSGDRKSVVEAFSSQLPFRDVRGELTPENKREAVMGFKDAGGYVAMVGDGINDSSALAQADLGISFQEGSELAKGSADLVLMKSDLSLIEDAFDLSYAIRRKILQNYFWAFLYNTVSIPVAMCGLLNPMIAAVAMTLSSISVLTNSMLLRRSLTR
ncbi:cadmium-translocating P-type ATPase [bacterium]|nr:cadmium-translocating P-type ATPase [bacterium]